MKAINRTKNSIIGTDNDLQQMNEIYTLDRKLIYQQKFSIGIHRHSDKNQDSDIIPLLVQHIINLTHVRLRKTSTKNTRYKDNWITEPIKRKGLYTF